MRLSSVLTEALRSTATRTSRPILALVSFVVVIGALCLYDAMTVRSIVTEFRAFHSAGATISTVASTRGISGRACERLAGVAGAGAAGAMSDGGGVVFEALPSTTVPSRHVTPHFVDLLPHRVDPAIAGLLLSREVAVALGSDVGQTVATTAGPVAVAGIFDYPDDGRLPGLGWSVLVVVPADGMFDACWLDVPFVQSPTASFLLTAVAPSPVEKPSVSRLNFRLGEPYDVGEAVRARPSLLAVPSAAVFGVVLGTVLVRLRRLELASALHVGVRRSALLVQLLTENALWLAAAWAVIPAGVLVLALPESPGDRAALLHGCLRLLVLASAATAAGCAAGTLLVREKHLFRYAAER